MAAILEDDAKALLATAAGGSTVVPRGRRVQSAAETVAAAAVLGDNLVVKALIPTGRRNRVGGVRFAATAAEAGQAAGSMLGQSMWGFQVGSVLVEERVAVEHEYYVAIRPDYEAYGWEVTFVRDGGTEVEAIGEGQGVGRWQFRAGSRVYPYHFRQCLSKLGVTGRPLITLAETLATLLRVAESVSATLLEVNPIGRCVDNRMALLGVMLSVDDRVLPSRPALSTVGVPRVDTLGRPLTPLEQSVEDLNDRYPESEFRLTELPDGDLGFLTIGGGTGLVALDELTRQGGRPATLFDMIGSVSEEKFEALVSAVLRRGGLKGLFIGQNISAMAPVGPAISGAVHAIAERYAAGLRFPVVLRLPSVDSVMPSVADSPPNVKILGIDVTINDAVAEFMEDVRKYAGPASVMRTIVPTPKRG